MSTWEQRMTPRAAPLPRLDRVVTFWRVQAPASRRIVECALYRVDTGWELREQRSEEDVIVTHLFTTRDDEAIATMAEQWIDTLVAKGFVEIPLT